MESFETRETSLVPRPAVLHATKRHGFGNKAITSYRETRMIKLMVL